MHHLHDGEVVMGVNVAVAGVVAMAEVVAMTVAAAVMATVHSIFFLLQA